MIEMSPVVVVPLLFWGTLVGLDLVSVPQLLLGRPLVAGAVAGAIAGDTAAGLQVGLVMELFALDVLPVGASRYPDFGPGTVAAAALAAGSPWELTLGLSVTLALALAALGGWSLPVLRRANGRATQRAADAMAAGDRRAIRAVLYAGVWRDALRGLLLTAFGLAAADAAAHWVRVDRATALALTLSVVACGLGAAAGGALRSAGRSRRLAWLAAGAAAGALLAVLR